MTRYLAFSILFGLILTVPDPASGQDDGTRAGGKGHSGWSVPFYGGDSAPVVHDDTLIIGSADGAIHAFDLRTGDEIWQYQTGANLPSELGATIIYSHSDEETYQILDDMYEFRRKFGRRIIGAAPVIKNDTVFIGSKDHHFYALDAKTGRYKWSTKLNGRIRKKAFVTDQIVVVHAVVCCPKGDRTLYTLDAHDGQVIWSTKGQGWASYPAVSGGVTYYALASVLRAVDHGSHEVLWSLQLVGQRPGRTTISHEVILISALEGGGLLISSEGVPHVYGVDASTGKLLWDFSRDDILLGSDHDPLTVGSEFVFLVTEEGLAAVSISSGELAWFLEGGFTKYDLPLHQDLYVQSDTYPNKLFSVDQESGKINWQKRIKGLRFKVRRDDVLYVSAKNKLLALDSTTGKRLWAFKTRGFLGRALKGGRSITALPTVTDRQVIFPTHDRLYSINVKTGKLKRK